MWDGGFDESKPDENEKQDTDNEEEDWAAFEDGGETEKKEEEKVKFTKAELLEDSSDEDEGFGTFDEPKKEEKEVKKVEKEESDDGFGDFGDNAADDGDEVGK